MIREQEGSPVGLCNGRIAAKFSQPGDAQRSLLFLLLQTTEQVRKALLV